MTPEPSTLANGQQRLEDVVLAYLQEVDAGHAPSPDEVLARHPDLTEELKAFFADQGWLAPVLAPVATLAPPRPPPKFEARPFGAHLLLEEIAHGGMGVVYKARQLNPNRIVALKMILAGQLASAADVQRFRMDSECAAHLSHPHIVPIYEVGEHDGQPYFSMKFMEGGSLARQLPRFAADQPAAAQLMVTIARAVQHAHERGILHRDLKPGNILLDAEGQPHVADFGLSKVLRTDSGLTGSGQVVGTPSYMSPEQAGAKKRLSPDADVYSLGAILYELLTGRPPFRAETPFDTILQVLEREPDRPRSLNPSVERDLETICLKCLRKDPGKRYPSAAALADDLQRHLEGKPIRARSVPSWERAVKWVKRRPAAAALIAVSVLALLAMMGGGVGLWYSGRLQDALDEAREQRAEANRQRQAMDTLQRNIRYERDIDLAGEAWHDAQIPRLLSLLDGWRPTPEKPSELRGWEWYYLRGLSHKDLLTLKGDTGNPVHVAFHPDGRLLATASWDCTVRLWDVARAREIHILRGHKGPVHCVAFSPDGRWLASASHDGTVRLWDPANGKELGLLQHSSEHAVRSVAFSPDGKQLASAGFDRTVKIWDVATGKLIRPLIGHPLEIMSVAFSPDGKRLASAGHDRTVRLWDAATGETIRVLEEGHTAQISSVVFSPDGKTLATSSEDRTAKLWDTETGKERTTLAGHLAWVYSVAFSPDGRRLATASDDRTVKLWDASSGREIRTFRGHSRFVRGVTFSPDGLRLASTDLDGAVKFWDATGNPQEFRELAGHEVRIRGLAFNTDSQTLASASKDGTVRLWDVMSGRQTQVLTGHTREVVSVAFSPDGKCLASGSLDKTVRLWNAATGESIGTLKERTGAVESVAFSPDGRWLASAGEDRAVCICDVAAAKRVRTLTGPTQLITSLAFSPDGRRLAFGSADGSVCVTDTDSWEGIRTLQHGSPVLSVAFSPDNRLLASGSQDAGVVKLWDVSTREVVHVFQGDWRHVTRVTFSPDGRRLAVAGAERVVKLWDVASGHPILTLRGHTDTIYSLAFSPDGRWLASAGAEVGVRSVIRLWEAPPDP